MSPYVVWFLLSLLVCISAQDINSDRTLEETETVTDSAKHTDLVETTTATTDSLESEHSSTPKIPNGHRDKWPGLKANPPDFVPFPRKSRVTEFWADHPDFRGIPDLPAEDTEYPKWLLAVMGPINPTTHDLPVLAPSKSPLIEPVKVEYSDNRRPEFASEDEMRPSANEMRPSANEMRPSPNEMRPSANEMRPSPNEMRPSPNEMRPSPYEMRPSANEMRPSPNEMRPSPYEMRPSANEMRPSANEMRPSANEMRPSPKEMPDENDIDTRSESNNVRNQTKNQITFESPIEQPFLNSGIHNAQPVPTVSPTQSERDMNSDLPQRHYHPVLFRIPFILSLGGIRQIKLKNNQRNPNYSDRVNDNRYERRQPATLIERDQTLPIRRQNFRRFPMSMSRSYVLNQPEMTIIPIGNRNMQSRFRQPPFSQRHQLTGRFPIIQNRPQNPSINRDNLIVVDPQFSRNHLLMAPDNDNNSQRSPMPLTNVKNNLQEPGKQNIPIKYIQPPSTFPKRSGIGARNKRQSGFETFEPFGMGNIFSFFPQEKEPRNSFNWFPRESMMNIPTRQSPINSGGFIPSVNTRPTKKQTRGPQDAWRNRPTASNNLTPNYRNQNPQTNMQRNNNNNREIPEDFMIIRPNKAASQNGRSNQMPWMINNLFGSDLFPDNGDNKMWTIQNLPNDQPGTHNNQQPLYVVNQEPYHNNARTKPYQEETMSPPYNQQNQFQSPAYQPVENFNPNREQNHRSHIHNNIQRPGLPSQINTNDINQEPIQNPKYIEHSHGQPQEKLRPVPKRPVQSQVPVSPHGVWIPHKATHKNPPVIKSNHFHEVPRPSHRQRQHQHSQPQQPQHQQPHRNKHLKEQHSSATEVPVHTERSRQVHQTKLLPEIQKGRKKLSPSQVRHLLSLLPEFPKEVYKNPGHKGHTAINRQKRNLHGQTADNKDGALTQNYPCSNEIETDLCQGNSSNVPHLQTRPTKRKRREIKESLIQDVVFGSYGYHSANGYQDGSFSDFSSPFFGYMTGDKLGSDMSGEWKNMFNKGSHSLFNDWYWPSYGYYGRPHHGFEHFLHGHEAGHSHPSVYLGNYWQGTTYPTNDGVTQRVAVIPPAVPRANPNQLSYTARFRYRFGIYPGYSDFIPGTDDHKIFFFYNDDQKDRRPDAVVPFRIY